MEKSKEIVLQEEEKLFSGIDRGLKRIVFEMKGDPEVEYLASSKSRIEPKNYAEIINHCKKVCPPDKLQLILRLKDLVDKSIEIIIERYMEWAIGIGIREGNVLGVDRIESRSCAIYALYRAAFTYVPDNGFSNYAPFWIRQTIQKSADFRQLTLVDATVGREEGRDTMKDRIASNDSHYEPLTIMENAQMSEVFQSLLRELPPEEQEEVTDWWTNNHPGPVSDNVQKFATDVYNAIN